MIQSLLKKTTILTILSCIIFSASKAQAVVKPTEARIFREFKNNATASQLPDFSYAGYHYGEDSLPVVTKKVFNVLDYGVYPNKNEDQTDAVQSLINNVGQHGGGVIYFPKGKYYFNVDSLNKKFIEINYSNVILRGSGNDEDGTILYNAHQLTQYDISPWLSPAFIHTGLNLQNTSSFWGIDFPDSIKITNASSTSAGVANSYLQKATIVASVLKNALKGERIITVSTTKNILSGSTVLLGMYNTTKDGNLIKDILQPITQFDEYETSANNAGIMSAPSYQWLVEVEKVLNDSVIKLKQPLRRDILLNYRPVVALAPMLTGIGIENLRLESGWSGYYCHHGCDKNDPKQGKEMDYGWTAINLCRLTHSWVKDVAIDNFTNPLYLLDSRNCTISKVNISGHDGHSGIKIYSHACDNLISNIHFFNNYTHVLSGEGCAYGNVFSSINYTPASKKVGYFDFHGCADRRFSQASDNLFENIVGLQQVNSGGDPHNLPQTGSNNTWWNIDLGDRLADNKEFFYCWTWGSKDYSLHPKTEHYKQYPKSILVGAYSKNGKVTVGGDDSKDKKNEWIYTESINSGKVYPLSLYKAQLLIRLSKKYIKN